MENNETWRERLAALLRNRNDEGNLDTEPQEFFDLFAAELLSLADKIGAEKKDEHTLEESQFNYGLDTAISVIKEMAK